MTLMDDHNSEETAPQDPFRDSDVNDSEEVDEEFPCRPCSRLSFNQEGDSSDSDEDDEDSSESEDDSDFIARLLQRSRVIEAPEIKSSGSSPPQRSPLARQPSFCAGDTESSKTLSSPSELQPVPPDPFSDSPYDPSDLEEFHKPLNEPEDWSIKPKFSCLPSPLSPHHYDKGTYTYRYTPPRHCYGNHGLSRHALHHSKWFWAVREEVWLERQAEADPFEDPILPWTKPPSSLPYVEPESPSIPAFTTPPRMSVPPMTIHPRRGDLTALRDPYSMHIDRYFVGMPLWTMAKTLWMFDLHMASVRGPLNCSPILDSDAYTPGSATPVDEDDTRSCASIQRSDSAGFSDDSDSTLVESDSEGDPATPPSEAEDPIPSEESSTAREPPPESTAKPNDQTTPTGKTRLDTNVPASPPTPSGPVSPIKPPNHIIFAGWPPNWYRRWDVLLHLCFKKTVFTPDPARIPPPVRSGKLDTVKRKPKFFVGDEDDDTWNDSPLKVREEDLEEEVGRPALGKEKVLFVVNRVSDEEEAD